MALTIWHNPSCSTCRKTLARIIDAGIEPDVRRYLDEPPSPAELDAALDRLGLEPWELTRMKEPLAAELGLADLARDAATREGWIAILSANPAPDRAPGGARRRRPRRPRPPAREGERAALRAWVI